MSRYTVAPLQGDKVRLVRPGNGFDGQVGRVTSICSHKSFYPWEPVCYKIAFNNPIKGYTFSLDIHLDFLGNGALEKDD